jgi:membrane protein
MAVIDRVEQAVTRRARALRARWAWFDHAWRAYSRYDGVYGTRLAAALAYYAFFAAFALAVVSFAVLGWVIPGSNKALAAVQDYLTSNLPQLDAGSLTSASRRVGIIALVGLIIAGVAWVENLRSSQRALWCLEQEPGHPVVRWLLDLAVLTGLGVLLLASLAVSSGIRGVLVRVSSQAKDVLVPGAAAGALNWTDTLLAALVDLVLAAALLVGVPRLRMPLRRLMPSAILIVIGLGVLKVVGRYFITRTQANPAYEGFTAAAAAVGLLLFMYFFHQIVLYAAALAATSGTGRVLDLSVRPIEVVDRGRDADVARNPNVTKLSKE